MKPPNKTQIIYPSNILFALHNNTKVPDDKVVVIIDKKLQGAKRYAISNIKLVDKQPYK